MPDLKRPYDEKKTTQAAALILKLNGGPMRYMKLVKLLYNIDREALHRWGRPMTYDEAYSLPHGLILSKTLNKARDTAPIIQSYWHQCLSTNNYSVHLKRDIDDGELSEAEVELINEFFERYKGLGMWQLAREHHDPKRFPEWRNPGDSSIAISVREILEALGYDKRHTDQIVEGLAEDATLIKFTSP